MRCRRLGGAELGIDAEAKGGGETNRKTLRRQTLPVLQGPSVVVGIIRLKAAQQQLPFQKRRAQADALQRGASVVVFTGFCLPESAEDADKFGVEGSR